MGVLVCYDDFTYDVVNDYHLDYLVQAGCIVGYDTSGDWVKNDLAPVRTPKGVNDRTRLVEYLLPFES